MINGRFRRQEIKFVRRLKIGRPRGLLGRTNLPNLRLLFREKIVKGIERGKEEEKKQGQVKPPCVQWKRRVRIA